MTMARAVHRGPLRSALVTILPAAVLVGCTAQIWILRFGLGPAYLLKSVAVFAAAGVLACRGVTRHHPFDSFGPANQVTVVRAALVALTAGLIGERAAAGAPLLAVTVAILVAILDGIDGWLARRTHMSSRFGARFDMETDAVLVMVLAILAWQFGKAGAWVLGSGLLRYAFVGLGALLPWLRHPLPPSQRRKVVAVVQIVALILALSPWIGGSAAALIAVVGLLALSLSFAVDGLWLHHGASRPRTAATVQ